MKNYDEMIDYTMCARCLEIKREQFPNTRCPWRSIDNEYCDKAQALADYIQELKAAASKSSFKDSWKNKFFKLLKEKAELQKRADELTDHLSEKQNALWDLQDDFENLLDEGKEQAVKGTAKEIAKLIKSVIWEEDKGETVSVKDLHGVVDDILRNKYGLEVE